RGEHWHVPLRLRGQNSPGRSAEVRCGICQNSLAVPANAEALPGGTLQGSFPDSRPALTPTARRISLRNLPKFPRRSCERGGFAGGNIGMFLYGFAARIPLVGPRNFVAEFAKIPSPFLRTRRLCRGNIGMFRSSTAKQQKSQQLNSSSP